MRNKTRNVDRIILKKIIGYCDDINCLMLRFNATFEQYVNDIAFQYSCNMCILQIGELTTRLSESFKLKYKHIPWQSIKGMRNIHAHEYEKIDFEGMWDTLKDDIPELKDNLLKILTDMENDGQDALESGAMGNEI